MMPYKLIHPQCTFSHVDYLLALIQLRREIQIKLTLLNILQLFVFMIMCTLNYKTCSPYVSILLGILSIITLGWLAICQQRHIEKLGKTITALCMQSPFNNPDQEDRVSENGQHWE